MRALVRLADGSTVEGELLSYGYNYAPGAASACAGGDFGVVYSLTIPTAAACIPTVLRSVPNVAGCAQPTTTTYAFAWPQD